MSHTEQLRDTLTHLHQELDRVSTRDPEVRTMLQQTLREIADKLEGQEPPTALASGETIDMLRGSAAEFEAKYPALATALESVVDALSRMGI